MKDWKHFFTSTPQAALIAGFAALIAIGAAVLMLPFAHAPGRVSPLDALFTSTSAVCVTGLVTVDTGKDFTLFGQIVILMLIQIGGLGVTTFAAIATMMLSGRLSFTSQAALSDVFFQKDMAFELKRLVWLIVKLTLVIEGIGALILFIGFARELSLAGAVYASVFHSVSAFCNAGFSIFSDSLIGYRNNMTVIVPVMGLIVLGGIGHMVLAEVWDRVRRPRNQEESAPAKWSFHFKIAVSVSAILVVVGFVALLMTGLTPGEQTFGQRVWGALFQSVTARTAGFNSIDIGALPMGSLVLIAMLMFVGGSPGSCAGGIKTTSLAIWLARLRCRLSGRSDTVLSGRSIPVDVVRRVSILVGLALLWNALGMLLLGTTEQGPDTGLEDILFEQISAFGTVGLSTGLTPNLSAFGRLWIILTMFVGRLGPLTLVMWAIPLRKEKITYPEGRIMIG